MIATLHIRQSSTSRVLKHLHFILSHLYRVVSRDNSASSLQIGSIMIFMFSRETIKDMLMEDCNCII